jgi:hypothetical protein
MNHFVIGHRLLFAVCRTAARWEGFICARGTEHTKKKLIPENQDYSLIDSITRNDFWKTEKRKSEKTWYQQYLLHKYARKCCFWVKY